MQVVHQWSIIQIWSNKGQTFTDWPVGLQEIWLQINLKQVASDAFHCVINGQNVDTLSILDIWTRLDAVEAEVHMVNINIQVYKKCN